MRSLALAEALRGPQTLQYLLKVGRHSAALVHPHLLCVRHLATLGELSQNICVLSVGLAQFIELLKDRTWSTSLLCPLRALDLVHLMPEFPDTPGHLPNVTRRYVYQALELFRRHSARRSPGCNQRIRGLCGRLVLRCVVLITNPVSLFSPVLNGDAGFGAPAIHQEEHSTDDASRARRNSQPCRDARPIPGRRCAVSFSPSSTRYASHPGRTTTQATVRFARTVDRQGRARKAGPCSRIRMSWKDRLAGRGACLVTPATCPASVL